MIIIKCCTLPCLKVLSKHGALNILIATRREYTEKNIHVHIYIYIYCLDKFLLKLLNT